jgi:bifunctional UDP-N-acetylglucosamine pyrophosphorylase/glucosamine-1-phosphate N-acetyltransferase
MQNQEKIQIIILAAGMGTRMKTDNPKALAPFKGKPFLKHILETIEKLSLPNPPVIVVGHKKEKIFEIFGNKQNYAHQKELLGTGHAVNTAKEKINMGSEIIIVISADQPMVSTETLLNLIQKHQEEKPAITLATADIGDFAEWRKNLINFGRIVRDENRKLKNIVEYKDANEQERAITEVNPAIYAFDSKWLWQNIDKLNTNNKQKEYYLTDLIKIACEQKEKLETIPLSNILEVLQPNSLEEIKILEDLTI